MNIGNAITGAARQAGFFMSKHAPEFLTGAGILLGGATVYLSCKATLKVDSYLEKPKDILDTAKQNLADEELTQKEYHAELRRGYFEAVKGLAICYGPAILTGTASVTCILAGQNIIQKRYASSVAACKVTEQMFREYRKRVIAEEGDEADRKYRFGVEEQSVVSPMLDKDGKPKTDKNGEVKTKTEKVKLVDPANVTKGYARVFDEVSSTAWDKGAAYNKTFLLGQQNIANQLLQSRGYIFLNEVYQMLGFPITAEGQDVGWLYVPNDDTRDNYVDFRMYDLNENGVTRYDALNDWNNAILLDFNCDGYIKDELFKSQTIYG